GGGLPNFRQASDDTDGDSFEPDVARVGEAVVSEFLWQKGFSRVDYLVATHADADHMQGLADVAANFDIGGAFFGRTPAGDPDFVELSAVLKQKNIKRETFSAGDSFLIGGATVEVLNPAAESGVGGQTGNDDSVVLKISFGERTFLLTGDIERIAETDILDRGSALRADVVKVPHHGSKTSSTEEFVKAAAPKFAVISVGRHSRFGHPNQEVVERWKNAGSQVWTTGEKGTVTFSTDGKGLDVEIYVK
ncbi:MAG TPA: ComEC/Rec2 family competence protein, partial [Pyrinomonadaceae bacterium]|nr:ComEC/Rec2 family competence protein [Pyrinomonadaceae bacterium]